MNQEAVFALKFVVKDLAKMRKAMDEMNKNLAKMQQNANKASISVDKINTSMGKTVRTIGKFALAYFGLSKIISTVFSKANESAQLEIMAQTAGVARKEIGKLGKALRLYGGDARSAGSAYASLTNIIGGATHGMGISEDVARVNAMYGIGFNYGNISKDALMTEIARSMHKLRGQGDQWAINQIASAYGLDSSMAEFLTKHGAGWRNYVNSQEWQDINVSDSQRLLKAEEDIKAKFDIVINELLPRIADGVEGIYRIINATLGAFAMPKGLAEKEPKVLNITDESRIKYAQHQYEMGKISKEKYDEIVLNHTTTPMPWATEALKNIGLAKYWKEVIESSENPLAEMAHLMKINKDVKFNTLPLASGLNTYVDVGGQKVQVFLKLTDNTRNGVIPAVMGASVE